MEKLELEPLELEITLSDYERERGKPMPSMNHSIAQSEIVFVLKTDYRTQFSVLSELSVTLNGNKFTPDVAVYPPLFIDWQHDIISFTEPPLTTIEIISPTQSLQELTRKTEDYFTGGVKSCWIVMPGLQTILVMQPDRSKVYFQSNDTLQDPATGISLDVGKIFVT
jgi:Uma2 family endonuclease